MKAIPLILMLFVCATAVSIGIQDSIDSATNTTLLVSIYGGQVGQKIRANWTNEKIWALPTEFTMTGPNNAFTFYIFLDVGACSTANITFSIADQKKSTALNMGSCTVSPAAAYPATTPLESRFYDEIQPKIDRANNYLQISPLLQAKINQVKADIQAVFEEEDFVQRDILAHQTDAKLDELGRSFPYVNQLSDRVSYQGNTYLKEQIESAIGDEVEPIQVIFSRKEKHLQVTEPGITRDFTLYEVRLYNPALNTTSLYFAENLQADRSDTEPYINQTGLTVWKMDLASRELKILKWGVFRDVETPITSYVFKIKVPEPEPEPEIPANTTNATQPEPAVCNYNRIWDNGESGIDCGGPCPPCAPPEPEPEMNVTNATFVNNYVGLFKVFWDFFASLIPF